MSAEQQFRIAKLQVFNWGTFSGVHDIPVASRGFLFVGRSGAGKTTLLDAFSALLVPPRWIDFNAAAREGERGSRDRSLVSYVRGAWAEQQDDGSGEIATQYLRMGTTWSGLALSYCDETGSTVVLVQLFWLRGKSNSRDDLKRYFLIFERPFDLRELTDFKLDIRKLKQQCPEAFAREDFTPYSERFRRLLGIDNELALRLLHKTQSAKNLGDLNTFLRDFMLDKPETFAAAERLVAEFADLNTAHQAVLTAREQVRTLLPARADFSTLQTVMQTESNLQVLRAGMDGYKETLRAALLGNRLIELETERQSRSGEESNQQEIIENLTAELRGLYRQHRESGGQQIEELEAEKRNSEDLRRQRLGKQEEARRACSALGLPAPGTPEEFAGIAAEARAELESWPQWQDHYREQYGILTGALENSKVDFAAAKEEVESLRRQSSNVPARVLKVRNWIASELGLAEDALPFAAELIEVLPRESAWQGAIERVLRGFALSLMVGERHYSAVSELVDRVSLGERLVYNRIAKTEPVPAKQLPVNSLVRKIQIKPGPFAAYLESELKLHSNLACVDSLQAFRNTDNALTQKGQIRRGKSRHEKDDRFDLNDRTRWVLGFDNKEKRELYERKALDAARIVEYGNRKIRELDEANKNRSSRALHCQTVANLQWHEVDAAPVLNRIAAIDRALQLARENNTELRELDGRIKTQNRSWPVRTRRLSPQKPGLKVSRKRRSLTGEICSR